MIETLIGNATVMGWTPQTLMSSSMCQYRAALRAWNRSRGVQPPLERGDVDRMRQLVAAQKRRREERERGRSSAH